VLTVALLSNAVRARRTSSTAELGAAHSASLQSPPGRSLSRGGDGLMFLEDEIEAGAVCALVWVDGNEVMLRNGIGETFEVE
jgi:hypothetical protein